MIEELEDVCVSIDFGARTITVLGVWSSMEIDSIRTTLFSVFSDDIWNDFDMRYQWVRDDTEQMYNWESNY